MPARGPRQDRSRQAKRHSCESAGHRLEQALLRSQHLPAMVGDLAMRIDAVLPAVLPLPLALLPRGATAVTAASHAAATATAAAARFIWRAGEASQVPRLALGRQRGAASCYSCNGGHGWKCFFFFLVLGLELPCHSWLPTARVDLRC